MEISPANVAGDDETHLFAMQLVSSSVMPMVLNSAIELGLLELMAKHVGFTGQMSPSDIASHLPTTNPDAPAMLDRMLRLLAAYSVLTCSVRTLPDTGGVERLYGLGPVCKYLVKNEDGVSIAALSLLKHDRAFMESWYSLKDAVLEGGVPFNRAHRKAIFEYTETDQSFGNVLNATMSNLSTISMKKILETYKGFEGLSSLVDVGGGTGHVLNMIISKYPNIRGINLDLPHVVEVAPYHLGIDHVGGDMFVSVPKGDAIFLKWICHDWSEEECVKLLKNCYDALPDDGKAVVAESILPVEPDSSLLTKTVYHLDILVLESTTGKERTKDEFEALAKGAGFKGFNVVCNAFGTYIMEFLKNI